MRIVFTYDALTHRVRHAWIIEGTVEAVMFSAYINDEIGLETGVIEPLDPLREMLNWRDMGGEPLPSDDDGYLFHQPPLPNARPVETITLPGDADKATKMPGTLHEAHASVPPRVVRVVRDHVVTPLGTRGAYRCDECGTIFSSTSRDPICPAQGSDR
jgi:hypothetical protein